MRTFSTHNPIQFYGGLGGGGGIQIGGGTLSPEEGLARVNSSGSGDIQVGDGQGGGGDPLGGPMDLDRGNGKIAVGNEGAGNQKSGTFSAPSTGGQVHAPESKSVDESFYKSDATGMQGAAEDVGTGLVQLFAGIGQSVGAKKKENEAKRLFPALIDPMESSSLARYRRLSRNIASGTRFSKQMDQLSSGHAAMTRGIIKKSGGSVGLAVAGMAKATKNFSDQFATTMGELQKNRMAYEGLADKTKDRIVDRKLELEMTKYSQKMAEAMQQKQEGKANTTGGLTRTMSGVNGVFANMYGMGSEGGEGGGGGGMMGGMGGGGGGMPMG
jgi:hypothetical protein